MANSHIIESAGDIENLERYFGTLHVSVHTLFMAISGGLTWIDCTVALHSISWVWKYVFSSYIAFSVFAAPRFFLYI